MELEICTLIYLHNYRDVNDRIVCSGEKTGKMRIIIRRGMFKYILAHLCYAKIKTVNLLLCQQKNIKKIYIYYQHFIEEKILGTKRKDASQTCSLQERTAGEI